jgi:hypothetical protein
MSRTISTYQQISCSLTSRPITSLTIFNFCWISFQIAISQSENRIGDWLYSMICGIIHYIYSLFTLIAEISIHWVIAILKFLSFSQFHQKKLRFERKHAKCLILSYNIAWYALHNLHLSAHLDRIDSSRYRILNTLIFLSSKIDFELETYFMKPIIILAIQGFMMYHIQIVLCYISYKILFLKHFMISSICREIVILECALFWNFENSKLSKIGHQKNYVLKGKMLDV